MSKGAEEAVGYRRVRKTVGGKEWGKEVGGIYGLIKRKERRI